MDLLNGPRCPACGRPCLLRIFRLAHGLHVVLTTLDPAIVNPEVVSAWVDSRFRIGHVVKVKAGECQQLPRALGAEPRHRYRCRVAGLTPRFGWGAVTHFSVGTIKEDHGPCQGYVVDFPEQRDWSCADGELELVGDASVSPAPERRAFSSKSVWEFGPASLNCDG